MTCDWCYVSVRPNDTLMNPIYCRPEEDKKIMFFKISRASRNNAVSK